METRSPHSELSNAHPCLQTHRDTRTEESPPLHPRLPVPRAGRTCLLQTHPVNPGLPPLLQLQPRGKRRKDCISTVPLKMAFWLLERHVLYFYHIYNAKLSVSAGVTQGLPHAGQGTSHHFNPIAAGALTAAISLTSTFPVREAPQSLQELPRPGRETNPGCSFTIVLREKPARFQVKLLLADLLLEPELQVGPVPREEQRTTESTRLEKTSEMIESNLSAPPVPARPPLFPRAPRLRERSRSAAPSRSSGGAEALQGHGRTRGAGRVAQHLVPVPLPEGTHCFTFSPSASLRLFLAASSSLT